VSTVLLVQADSELTDGWSLALEASNHSVLAARTATEGIKRVREGGIDVIVVDGSPGSKAVVNFVSQLDRLPDAPPFILVSSSPDAPEISARLGASAFLPKPCSASELEALVTRLSSAGVSRMMDEEPTHPRVFLDSLEE
jgi:DNA-binding response OmpR family regulator